MNKVHILAFGAHPDDVELSCSGTLIKHILSGDKVAVVDLTQGELGTRGTAITRMAEAKKAAQIMGIHYRENLKFKDGFFLNNEAHQRKIIQTIRKYQPEIVLCNAIHDRHPDHGKGSRLISDACFLSGLAKIVTTDSKGKQQLPWKPKTIYHYIQDRFITPSFLIDISGFMDRKMDSVKAYKTQFYNPESNEPQTYISSEGFYNSIVNRAAEFGRIIGVDFAEGFIAERLFGLKNLNDLL